MNENRSKIYNNPQSIIVITGITLQEYNLARQDNQLQFICRPCEENYWSVAEQEPLPEPLPEIDPEPEPPAL
jgi:hypothetical protein